MQNLPKVTAKSTVRRAQKKVLLPVADAINSAAPKGKTGALSGSYKVSGKLNKRQRKLREKISEVETFVGTSDPAGVQTEYGNEHQSAQPHARPVWNRMKRGMLKELGALLWVDAVKTVKRFRKRAAKKGR